MTKHIHRFQSQAEFETAYNGSEYIEPWLSYTETKGVDYNIDYNKIPFTIVVVGSSGYIKLKLGDKTVQYSKNNEEWNTMDSGTTISVVEGDEVRFKGTNSEYNSNTGLITAPMSFNVKGNIMSLTNGDNFTTANTISTNCFRSMFFNCTTLVSAKNLKLPVTTLASGCYGEMFRACGSLIEAPELPATTLANGCYTSMFYGCSNLTTAPKLPATTLYPECYNSMFNGCTKLEQAPELPSEMLTSNCYAYMFCNCKKLNYIKAMFKFLPPQLSSATSSWVYGVASSGTFIKNAAATWTTTGANGVPDGWTVQTASA